MGLMQTHGMAPPGKPRTWGDWQLAEREQRGWSQITLAHSSGVSERSIKRYEKGEAPSGRGVWLILSAFGFPTPSDQPRALNAEVADMNVKLDRVIELLGRDRADDVERIVAAIRVALMEGRSEVGQ